MMTDSDRFYDLWDDLNGPEMICTLLFHLIPCGVGTTEVESLSSYIARIALAHSVRVYDLLRFEIVPLARELPANSSQLLPRITFSVLQRTRLCLNGINATTEILQEAIAQLTGNTQLLYLTMLPFSLVISPLHLLRDTHAWCPECYEKQRQNDGIAYDLLLWSLNDVNWCLEHDCALQHYCPYCNRRIGILPRIYKPGYCPHCSTWLGSEKSQVKATEPLSITAIQTLKFCAQAVGELVAATPSLQLPLQVDSLQRGIRSGIETLDSGNMARFASRIGLLPTKVGMLLHSHKKTSLGTLLGICQKLGISLKPLLYDGTLHYLEDYHPESGKRPRYTRRNVDPDALRMELETFATSEPPLSLREIGRRLKYCVSTLERYAPETCQSIVARFEEYQQTQFQQLREAAVFGLEEVLASTVEPPASLGSVARNLRIPLSTMYSLFNDLCKGIADKHRTYWANQNEREKERMQDLMDNIVKDFHERNCHPSLEKVLAELGNPTRFTRTILNEMRKTAMRKVGYRV